MNRRGAQAFGTCVDREVGRAPAPSPLYQSLEDPAQALGFRTWGLGSRLHPAPSTSVSRAGLRRGDSGLGVWGLEFGGVGVRFGVWDLGFEVCGLWFGVWGFGAWGLGFQGLGCGVWGVGCGVWGVGFRVRG